MLRGPYEVEGKTQAGNYLLKGVKGRAKERLGTLQFLQIS